MTDARKKYIINITGIYFNINSYENEQNVLGLTKLEQFLDNEQCVTLCATCGEKDTAQIEFHNDVVPSVNRMVIFFKNRQSRLNESNVHEIVQLVVLQGSPTASLYHTLHNVFTPLFIQEGKKSNAVNLNLQRQLTTFQTTLRSAAFVSDGDSSNLSENNSLSVISTLDHEVDYWNSLANSSKSSDIKSSSLAFRDILKPLARDFSMLDALPLLEIEDALEGAHNVLDDLWRHEPPYRRSRMQHLMDLIASDVIHCITRQLSNIKIWEDDYIIVTDLLEQSISAGKKWSSACTHLTQLFWPNYSLHPWTGDSYTPQSLADLVTRLEEVLNLRAIHRQLTRLLNHNEIEDLRTSDMFKPFSDINVLQCGPYSENSWKTAIKQFEYLLLPAEQRVGEKLKIQLANVSNNTRQLLYEFTRYSQLMDRPIVKKILLAERQNLLSSLGQYIKQLSGMMISEQSYSRNDTPKIITEISNVRQLESKAQAVQQTSEKLLSDLPGFEELQAQVSEFLKELKVQHSELFDSWTRELTQQINNKSLSLKESDPVVQFSSAQLMRVNYSPRLVSLVQEYRQLCALGYRIPSHIAQTASHAKQFMKYARALEQVANFHNTIGDRMVSAQRPMMLAGALELSKLVQQEEVVSWGDVRSVEKYVDSLRNAVNRLSRENNLLATYHMQMLDKIKELSDVDLIRHLQKWKDTAKNLREIMNQVEQQGFTNMQSWKLEIDRSLSDEFEKQYRQSLETVHLHLPEIYADLVYRDSHLQFNPPVEKLREKYQYQLQRFLDLPRSFRGVSDMTEGSVFAVIIEKCKDLYAQTEKHTEELFEKLKGVVEHWQSWLSLGVLDTSQLSTWQHWDLNFRASKTFGQEVAKLPSTEERVGCFVISLSCLRSDLESHNRSYWSQLMSSFQDSIAQDVVRLQQYVNSSTATLTKQPVTMEQIGQAHASHSDILKQMPEMQKLFEEMIDKNKTLASWTRERVESVARLQTAWERLKSLVDNHQHLISKQVEAFQSTINRTCENLNNEIERFSLHWDQSKPRPGSGQIANDSLKSLENYLTTIKEKRVQWDELVKQKDKVLSDCEQFGMDPPEFALCEQVQADMNQEEKIWTLFEEFSADLEKLTKEEWIVFRKRSYKLEDFVSEWQKRLESSQSTALSTRLLQELQQYEVVVPVLKYLRGEDFTEKHWIEVFSLLGIAPKPVDVLTLHDFLEVSSRISESVSELQAICKRAASEVVVRQALAELDQWEVQSRFVLTDHQDSQKQTVMLVKDFKDILNKIGDNQSLLQSVKNSADYESFSERAGFWEGKLADLDHYLVSLFQIQRKWVYLEPIFGSGTLRQERARFDRLDRDFRHVLSSIERDSRVTSLARYSNIRAVLDTLQDQLSRCQNSLDNFLAERRLKFPRFLFLGDDDLLEILGQSSREQVIQAHLKKLFSGIHSVRMSSESKEIVAMCSLQGEVVPLSKSVSIDCPVEDWLNQLVLQMQNTLRQLLKQCLLDSLQSGPDPLQFPSQVLCLADSITFTTRCEQAIRSATLPPLLATYKNQLKSYSLFELTNEDISGPSSENRDENILEIKMKALMLDTIQHIDVIEELIDNNVTSINDWYWQKQLRFYNNLHNDTIIVRMANAEMNYSFEYLGNANKLVRTPLTDKCFLTLTQGMHLGMGGNPYGPAGTGKTESVKALGSLLGRQVLVFNCDEGVDATSMGRILSGLVRSGAWGCFDEFNRLDEATLSAVSMHIQPIQIALRTGKKTVVLLDQQMEINPHCGIFVTLNPVGGGYKGRNRLPDNLKQLFRPVVMSHPDHEQIARTLLRCDGYQNADLIGKKLVEVFTMANELLSKQQHYDWGLRALKTVIGGCGSALNRVRRNKDFLINSNITNAESDILKQEMQLVVEALRVNTLSKLTYADSERFDSLVCDIFVGIPFQNTGQAKLVAALEESCTDLGLQINERQISKCVELYEQLQQRMGVTIVGPSGSGKSTLRKILLRALNKMSNSVTQHVFNPKAMTRAQLLGHVDLDTRQWTDGVLTLYALQVYAEPSEVWSWVVCDGDIDPEWVESLNSVLDDNRLLTLPSGWRIQFGPNVNFLFETHDMSYASPATVSRMGIVFLSEEDVKLTDIVNNWLSWQPEDTIRISSHLLNDYFFTAIDWIKTEGDLVIPCSNVSIVQIGLSQLMKISSKAQFTVALIAGLGGLLTQQTREVFAQKVFEWTGEHCPDEKLILRCAYNQKRDIIDIYYSDSNYQILDTNLNDLPLVLTGQVIQTLDILKPWVSVGTEEHFLLVGPHGSAKSLIINHLVREQYNMDIATIYCSNNIMPQYVLHKLTQHCMVVSSNRGRVYRPKKGRLLLYFKGLHLLKPDKWGTNILIAFLHQLITYGGLFDPNLEWVGLESVTIVGSLSSTDSLSTRFTSVMKIHNIDLPEKEDLSIIYESYMTALVKSSLPNNSVWAVKSKITKLITTLIAIYEEVKSTFTVMQQRHYIFSPHDLTNWCSNLIRYRTTLSSNPTDSENTMLEILIYEAFRLFGDKLVNVEDRNKFESILAKAFQMQWGKSTLISNLKGNYYVPSEQYNSNKNNEIISLTRLNSDDWSNLVKKGILHFGREGQTLDLLIISELLLLTSSIARSLSQNGGCVLLAGRSGVGRHSSVRVVSALQSAKLFTPISGTLAQFKNDLKSAMQVAGVEGEQVYFMLEDYMMRKSSVVDMVNTLLAAGEIPGLHTTAELDSLTAGLKDEADRENFEGNHIQYFVQRVRNNLHLVICLEVDSSEFWRIIENYPILYQRCTVIWHSEWSPESMTIIPNLLLQKLSENGSDEGVITTMPSGFYDIHKQAKSALATPRRYLFLINSYINLYTEKKKIILQRQSKLQAGITKLTEARNVVADLKVKALEQQKILAEKQDKANSALDMISATMKNANVHKQEMEVLKEQTEKENEQLIKRKKAIEVELAEVEPILQEARAAVGNIKPESLSEIRSLRAPPDVIRDILEGVLRLMGTQDTSWNSMKTFLAKRGVKEEIRSFDASRINPDNRQAVERLITARGDSFDPKAAKRASVAAAPLASWVKANVKFSQVVEKIRPLEREQYKLQQNLKNAEQQIGELSAGLSDVDAKVAQLKIQLSTYTKEAAEIEINLQKAEDKLHAAEGLVNKLNEEYDRWKIQLKELSEDLNNLPMKCLLAAAYICYLPGEFENERKLQIEEWCNILIGESYEFSFEEFLSSEREQLQWQTEGLLSDQLSVHNVIAILKTNINVLLLDPSSLALQWLRNHFKNRTVEIVNQNTPRFITSLELAVRFGKVFIIEEIDDIPPILFPLLRKEFVYQGTRRLVLLGNKLIDYHNDFCLYLSSRNLFVDIPPDASAVINIVNFTTTKEGLTEQLLSGAIRQEYPELETKRNELLQKQEELQEQQFNLQNQLLEELANAKGDILQNKQLLGSLNETKASSIAIATSLKESSQIQEQLKSECDILRPLSSFGSLLYFATTDLVRLNVMYSISISAFIKLFLSSISATNNAQGDYSQVQKVLLQSVYSFVGRGMFKSDRLLFALYLCKHMFPGKISKEEWSLFLGHTKSSKINATDSETTPKWISEQLIHNVINLQTALPNLYNSLKLEDENSWNKFMKSRECEKDFPSFCNLTDFQQVLIVQMLRPDRLYTVMSKCVLHLTGMKNLSPRVLYLSQLFKETVPVDPVLLITAPGADPSSELRDLAAALIGVDKYKEVAMGEGQESLALQSLEDSAKLGHWLCLKNLHLVTGWSSLLSQKIQTLNPHENFRLWLVTEPHPMFSSVLIQSCTKLAYEAPPGIKNNLLRSYATWGKSYVQKQNATGARILFVLAYVHALLQERRSYIPQGWTKWYEFSDVDLYTAANLSEEIWGSKSGPVLWNHIRGLSSDAVYGGRIDERQDDRVLLAYLRQNFVDTVLGHKWKLIGMDSHFPNNNNYQEYIDCINQLADNNDLSYFGLPANIDRAWEINMSIKLISNLKVIQLPLKSTTKIERDDWTRGLAPLLNFWKKLNKGQEWLRINVPKAINADNPVSTYMIEEKRFTIELVQNIHRSLISLSKITRGTALPTEKDIEIVNSLLAYQTPYEWISFWKGPTEPFKYLQTVTEKAIAVSKWNLGNDSHELLLNSTINLSHMFRPQVFLAALKQHTSRLIKVAVNDLHLINSWQKSFKAPGSVTLIGIFIEGALFDGENLVKCSSDSENISLAPVCSIAWVTKKSFDRNENNLEVPLYSSSRREELLSIMLLPSDKRTHDLWTLAGVSLFLEY